LKNILFVCVHNSGRSQIAEAAFNHFAQTRNMDLVALSAGTNPADRLNTNVIESIAEIGIQTSGLAPKQLTNYMVEQSEIVITLGCNVDSNQCPSLNIREVIDWGLPDPSGMGMDATGNVRDEIIQRVEGLLASLNHK